MPGRTTGYRDRDHGLPLADSIICATAQVAGATVWTQEADFEGLEEVRFVDRG